MIFFHKTVIASRKFFRRLSRIVWNAILAFSQNEDSLKASALTYYTLISIVPFLAVAFGVATGFGFQEYLEEQLTYVFSEQKEVLTYAMRFAHSMLKNAKGGLIAGVGLVTLLWSNISMLNTIESALNEIWHVRQPRSWSKKISDYIAAMIICPIFLVVSSSLSVFLMTQLTETAKAHPVLELLSTFFLFLFNLLPFLFSILLFVVIYLFLPNTRIESRPRIIAGIIGGVIFQLWQWVYIKFQVVISSYGAIYGTFAALPLFLLWLQVSWLILLAGAELAAQIENEKYYARKGLGNMHPIYPKELGLILLAYCVRAYSKGEPPPTALQLAKDLSLSPMVARQMLDSLTASNLLVEVTIPNTSRAGYQPSRDARLLSIKNACDTIEKQMSWQVPIENTPAIHKINNILKELDQLQIDAKQNISLDKLAQMV